MSNPTLHLFRGLPGSGKSTKARQLVKDLLEQGREVVHLERDMYRAMFPGINENVLTTRMHSAITEAIADGKDVINSDTNLRARYLKDIVIAALRGGEDVMVEVRDMRSVSLTVALSRNSHREAHKFVPEDVIVNMYERSVRPISKTRTQEDFDAESSKLVAEASEKWAKGEEEIASEKYIQPNLDDTDVDQAFLVDIDGTLANHEGVRSPYDLSMVIHDRSHKDVIDLVNDLYHENKIIIMSGRHMSAREDTEKWLKIHGVRYDELIMREDPQEKDHKEKVKLFNKYVRDEGYFIRGVFDDRDRVVNKAWRETLGLRCYQVAPGSF